MAQEYIEIKEVIGPNGIVLERIITTKQTQPKWQASAWILERRHRNVWGKHKKSVDGQDAKNKYNEALSLENES